MKKNVLLLVVCAIAAFCTVPVDSSVSEAAQIKKRKLSKVCKSVLPLRKSLLKNAGGGHITNGDARAAGFAFICGPDCPRRFPLTAYYSDGTQAFRLGYYGKWEGNGRPRAYCAAGGVPICYASAVTKAARSKKRDGKVYISYGDGSCRSAIPGARNGSPF